jgi:dTDP-4-dehydrorhamnose 3,5-epimerase
MQCRKLAIADVVLITPSVFEDDRGFFLESFNARDFASVVGPGWQFVQDNHSKSGQGVLRGLHYQLQPHAQGKLIRVVQGKIFDVAVDIRKGSATFGQWVGETLSAVNKQQLWIPPGFAHGFLVLSETAEVLYKATDFYTPAAERCIAWNDPQIGIQWPGGIRPLLSAKDRQGVSLADAELM